MSDQNYSWRNVKQGSSFRLPKSENVGRWLWAAIALAVIVHGIVLIALKKMPVLLNRFDNTRPELTSQPLNVERVEFEEAVLADRSDEVLELPDQDVLPLLDELDLLEIIPEDIEVEISPSITNPEIAVEMEVPALSGSLLSDALEPVAAPDFVTDVPELGRTEDFFQQAADGQVIIDAGELKADEHDPDAFTESLLKQGVDGLADDGVLEGFTSLSDMQFLTGNELESSKAMIGSDLLFEYNSSELKETARHSLLKVALLIDKNSEMNCWVEGHSDLFGGDTFNDKLSLERAQAVKKWLVESMRLNPERVFVRGMGKRDAIVTEGDQKAQAINRRVEIKIRKGVPEEQAVLVKPLKALPRATVVIEEETTVNEPDVNVVPSVIEEPVAPSATVIEEELEPIRPSVPRALPIEQTEPATPPAPVRAVPVE